MKRIILDVDSAGDDILAILYAACNEQICLEAVTTVTGASGDIQQATWVALNTLEYTKKETPVYSGASKPLKEAKKSVFDGDPVNFYERYRWKFGVRLDEFNSPAAKPKREAENMNAIDYIVDIVNRNPGQITVVTTGPLTNIAKAIEKDPSFQKKIKELYCLGGAFKSPGNISPVTEYNIFADPEAANVVFNSGIEITLFPLDICENNRFAASMLTRDVIKDIESATNESRMVKYISKKFPIYILSY